jgi:hypothetical protein
MLYSLKPGETRHNKRTHNMKDLKKIPDFQNEDEEREFWEKNDSGSYMDWEKAQAVRFPNLKKSPIRDLDFGEGVWDSVLMSKRSVKMKFLL